MIKPMGLISYMQSMYMTSLYIPMFIVLQNNLIDSSYFMLLGRPWSRHAKVAHDWGQKYDHLYMVMEQLEL
jgi:hypothetical protein